MDKRDIMAAVKELGIAGADVIIHSSMRSFGEKIEGGAEAIIDAFIESGCTVMVPSFSDMYEARPVPHLMPEQNGAGDYSYFMEKEYEDAGVYSPESNEVTVEEMGVFPKALLEKEGRVRGRNPLNSFAALGKNAHRLIDGQSCQDVYAPLKQLCADGGYVLLMGVDLTSATIIHHAEEVSGRVPFVRWAKDEKGNVIPVSAGSCSEGFGKFAEILEPFAKRIYVGKSEWTLFRAEDITRECAQAMKREPMISHCGDMECSRCNDAVKGGPDVKGIF